jgi:hypothetical protein
MDTSPGGDAMEVSFHREAELARLKRAEVPRPVTWRIHGADAARFAAAGRHCETRRCRELIAVVTWRWFRSTRDARVLLAEHEVCVQHGQEFADRHHISIERPPARPSSRSLRGGSR